MSIENARAYAEIAVDLACKLHKTYVLMEREFNQAGITIPRETRYALRAMYLAAHTARLEVDYLTGGPEPEVKSDPNNSVNFDIEHGR